MGMAVATGMAEGDGLAAVAVPATADTPEAVVRFLAGWLVADGQLPLAEREPVVVRVLRRERWGPPASAAGWPSRTQPARPLNKWRSCSVG